MRKDNSNQLSNIVIEKEEERYSSWCFLLMEGTEFETALYDNFIDILCSFWFSSIQIWKSKTHYNRNHYYYYRLFCPFHISFNRSFDSCSSCLCSCRIGINADRFSECSGDFDSKAIQWNIIGDESFNFPYWILCGTCDCRNIKKITSHYVAFRTKLDKGISSF
jgi:hypothetical protein